MKKASFLLVMIVLAIGCTFAQTVMNPTAASNYYVYPLATAKAYANSQTDTLPSPSATPSYVRGAFAALASLTVQAADSAAADIYVESRVRGESSYSVVATDSLVGTSNTINSKEIVLRSATVSKFGGIDQEFRVRIAWRSSKNGVTSATYGARYNWIR